MEDLHSTTIRDDLIRFASEKRQRNQRRLSCRSSLARVIRSYSCRNNGPQGRATHAAAQAPAPVPVRRFLITTEQGVAVLVATAPCKLCSWSCVSALRNQGHSEANKYHPIQCAVKFIETKQTLRETISIWELESRKEFTQIYLTGFFNYKGLRLLHVQAGRGGEPKRHQGQHRQGVRMSPRGKHPSGQGPCTKRQGAE